MPAWNFERLQRSLAQGEISPVYCLHGEETFLIEQCLKSLIEKGLDGAPRDFNVDVFFAGDSDATNVKDAVEMLPMMAPRRIVVLKNADSLKAKDLEELLPLVETPIDSTTFLILAEKIDSRKKFFKAIEKNGVVVKLDRLPEQQLPGWIQQMSKQLGKDITPQAVELICQMVGASLLDVSNELTKLSQFIGERTRIEVEDVKQVVSHSRMESVFGLTNAIGERDRAKALTFLAQLLDHGESEVGILALISRHLRILTLTQEALSSGLSRSQISTKVGVPSFFIQNYIDQAQRWQNRQLVEALEACLDTDRALKSSPVSSHIWLENFIIKSC